MSIPQMEDSQDNIEDLLIEIRDAVQGGSMPGQQSKSTSVSHTELRVHDISGKFTPPSNTFHVGNQTWVDEKLTQTQIDDLAPGESQTVCSLLSNETSVYLAVKGVSTTEHVADVTGDGQMESVVQYEYEYQTHGGGDNWNPLIGLSGSTPMGYMGNTAEIVPGEFIGPMSGFRINFHNRTDDTANAVTVPAEEIGAQIAGIFIRSSGGESA